MNCGRAAFFIVWPVAVLDVFGLLGPVVNQMQTLSLPLGESQDGDPVASSLLDVVRTLIYFVVLFWGANLLSRLLQQQINKIEDISPSFKAWPGKVLNVLLAIWKSLKSEGIEIPFLQRDLHVRSWSAPEVHDNG